MGFSLNRNTLCQILLGISCAVPYLSNYELTFFIWLFTILLTLQKNYSLYFLKYVSFFLVIFAIAVATTSSGAKMYFIIRDITYMLKPVMGLLLGYQICRFLYDNALERLVTIGLCISIVHLVLIMKTLFIHHYLSVALLRQYCGYFSDFEVYMLILVIFHKKLGIEISYRKFLWLVCIIGTSMFMYLSRTNFIQFVVLFLAMKGYFVFNKRAVIAIGSVVLLSVTLYSVILFTNPRRTGSGVEQFLYKIKVAPTEPFKMRVDATDWRDFNLNYRSIEMIYTIRQVQNKGAKNMIVGSGLGSQINLKQYVFLGDMKLKFISVLHNGFLTTYLKSGILGVLILLYSIYYLARRKLSEAPLINHHINLLLIGTSIFLLVSNWVLMGYYFTQDSKTIIVGFLIALTEINARRFKQGLPVPIPV